MANNPLDSQVFVPPGQTGHLFLGGGGGGGGSDRTSNGIAHSDCNSWPDLLSSENRVLPETERDHDRVYVLHHVSEI